MSLEYVIDLRHPSGCKLLSDGPFGAGYGECNLGNFRCPYAGPAPDWCPLRNGGSVTIRGREMNP